MKLLEIKQDGISYLVELTEAELRILQTINDIRIFDKVEIYQSDKGRSWTVLTTVKKKEVFYVDKSKNVVK